MKGGAAADFFTKPPRRRVQCRFDAPMKTVRIIKKLEYPDLMRQTPLSKGLWNGVFFTGDRIRECDYLIVLNLSAVDEEVVCRPRNVWCLHQEPHNEYFGVCHSHTPSVYSRVFTTDTGLKGPRYVHTHGALSWHVDKSYDELKSASPPEKSREISLISSSKTHFRGHRRRLDFVRRIPGDLPIDCFGHGIRPLRDKWDGIAPYRYSIAVENFSSPHYWTEKLADCFLAWTMPVYYGCRNLSDYFPEESFIRIDVSDPRGAAEIIREAVALNAWKRNFEAISHARQLILEKYQFFPFMCRFISEWEAGGDEEGVPQRILVPGENRPSRRMFLYFMRRFRYLLTLPGKRG
ncbi:MAG TPA: glycosyltransferase family 10 [Syntrophales bacterium]|nr:glycosyltransferase family 10 [Syntrophales bacterium]HQQ27927.1 glycosyltransferase family 10 [Syntrophales bacterium]